MNVAAVKSTIPVLSRIRSKEDKVLKKPELRKFSVENFKQKANFFDKDQKAREKTKSKGTYDINKIIHSQLSNDNYLHGYNSSAREIREEKKKIEDRMNSQRTSCDRRGRASSSIISGLGEVGNFRNSVLRLSMVNSSSSGGGSPTWVGFKPQAPKVGSVLNLKTLDHTKDAIIHRNSLPSSNPIKIRSKNNFYLRETEDDVQPYQNFARREADGDESFKTYKDPLQLQIIKLNSAEDPGVESSLNTEHKGIALQTSDRLTKDEASRITGFQNQGSSPERYTIDMSSSHRPDNDTQQFIFNSHLKGGILERTGDLSSKLMESHDPASHKPLRSYFEGEGVDFQFQRKRSVLNASVQDDSQSFQTDQTQLRLPEVKARFPRQAKLSSSVNGPAWVVFDPLDTFSGPRVSLISWTQMVELKLLLRMKLNQNGYRLDLKTETNFENFVRMKQKIELQNETLRRSKGPPAKRVLRSQSSLGNKIPTEEVEQMKRCTHICKDLTKWMRDNMQGFIQEFEPTHTRQNRHLFFKNDKITKSTSLKQVNKLRLPSSSAELAQFPPKSKMTAVWGSPSNIYGLESLESTRGEGNKPRDINTLIQQVKKTQLSELKKKNLLKSDKTAEVVYGTNHKSPWKKTIPEKVFETKLKRHVLVDKTDKLAGNFADFQQQSRIQSQVKNLYSPSKLNAMRSQKELEVAKLNSERFLDDQLLAQNVDPWNDSSIKSSAAEGPRGFQQQRSSLIKIDSANHMTELMMADIHGREQKVGLNQSVLKEMPAIRNKLQDDSIQWQSQDVTHGPAASEDLHHYTNQKPVNFDHLKELRETEGLHYSQLAKMKDEQITKTDMETAIKHFFDDLEHNTDKTTKKVFKNKLNKIVRDDDGRYRQKNLEYIASIDHRTRSIIANKKRLAREKKEKEMQAIFENTPYAFEACRFDRIMNPDKWFHP